MHDIERFSYLEKKNVTLITSLAADIPEESRVNVGMAVYLVRS